MRLAALVFLALLTTFSRPVAAQDMGQPEKNYLEGSWLMDQRADQGPCVSHWHGLGTEIEFEFRNSGGRELVFERPDLFTAIALPRMEKRTDGFIFFGSRPDGKAVPFMHVRLLPPNQLEIVYLGSGAQKSKPQIAYRCGAPDWKPTGDVPAARLAWLTPSITGSAGFVEAQDGVPDSKICQGEPPADKPHSRPRFLQFELLGPVHYWILGWPGWSKEWGNYNLNYAFVRSVMVVNDTTLALQLQEHLEKGAGWDVPESHGKLFTLTVIDIGGGHMEVPELNAKFVRCDHDGLHRW